MLGFFWSRYLTRFALCYVLLTLLMACFAPMIANDKALAFRHNEQWYFPFLQDTSLGQFANLYQGYDQEKWYQMMLETGYAYFAPIQHSPYTPNLNEILQAPSSNHIMGTDAQGRDVAARLIYGARISLSVGFMSVALACLIGIFVGAIAGYFGSWIDQILSRLIEIIICFPTFFLVLTIVALLGGGLGKIMLVLGLTGWTGIARLVRAEFLRLRHAEFIAAGQILGFSSLRVMLRHILPNALSPVLVTASFAVASSILVESSLSFLGFGVQPPTASWGEILSGARMYIDIVWWLAFFPGVAIFLTIMAYNLLGEAVRDYLDPKIGPYAAK